MHTVNEVSKLTTITSDSVRHYVRIGLLDPVRDPHNGYKLFGEGDIKKLKFIRLAKDLGFTLKDIKSIFEHTLKGQSPCPAVRGMIQQRIDEKRKKLMALTSSLQKMDAALNMWQKMPNGEPDGNAICHLIESID